MEGINTKPRLPRYVIIILDKDILESFKYCDYGLKTLLQGAVHWLHKRISRIFEARWEDLQNTHTGAVSSVTEPRLIWVKMVDRPNFLKTCKERSHMSLAWKFNMVLDEVLCNDKYSHVMQISLDRADFSGIGDLTASGRYNYWKLVLDFFKKFDKGEISLRTPSNNQHQ